MPALSLGRWMPGLKAFLAVDDGKTFSRVSLPLSGLQYGERFGIVYQWLDTKPNGVVGPRMMVGQQIPIGFLCGLFIDGPK